jgi:hypothetical protein
MAASKTIVIAGLDPAISRRLAADAWGKPGHDVGRKAAA